MVSAPVKYHHCNINVVYIRKQSSAHALGCVSGVSSFITIDEHLQKTETAIFHMLSMLLGNFPIHG